MSQAQAFEVQIKSSGQIIFIPEDISVVEALSFEGIDIPTSCAQGICGTCLTKVLEGVPEHRDQYLTPEERASNEQFTPCCSRAHTARLVLDL
jgi:vanillate O-demethylase ferredoxin subunit